MFAAESRITMTMLTAIVVFACTWLFANANSTTCPQALACMSKGSPGRTCSDYDTYFNCISALPASCDVDESRVTFKVLVQPAKDFCDALTPHLTEINSCPSYGKCLLETTLGQIINASGQPQENVFEHAFGLLLKSSTFCGLLEDMATCVVNETRAGRCPFSNDFSNTMKHAKQNISDVCDGKDANSSTCPQALACRSNDSPGLNCSDFDTYFNCISALPASCGVDESVVTCKALVQPAKDFCDALTPHLSEINSCPSYGKCLLETTLGQIINASGQHQENVFEHAFGLLLKSSTFCGVLEDMAACVVNETQAGRCSFTNDFSNTMKQAKQNISDVCDGKGTGGNLMIHAALILIGAVIANFIK